MCFNCGKVKGDVNKFCEQRAKLQTFADWERVESESLSEGKQFVN